MQKRHRNFEFQREQLPKVTKATASGKRPDEGGAIKVDAFIKIFDPKTKETFLEGKA